jgi:F-type H+-transporting ATPase subunit b
MAETHTETGAPAGGATGGFPPFDASTFVPQLFWLAITFTFLYVMLARVALPRIAQVIEDRRDRIADDLDAAEQHRQEANVALSAYDKVLADARGKAGELAAKTRDAMKADADKATGEVDADIARQLEAAEARIAEIKAQAMRDVRAAAIDVTGAIVDKIIRTRPSEDEIARAVDAALERAA